MKDKKKKKKDKLNYEDIFSTQEKVEIEKEVKSIEDELDIPEMKVSVDIKFDALETKSDEEDFLHDINYARTQLLKSMGQADQILQSLLKKIISDDEQMVEVKRAAPRYYEVSSQILKSICDASKEIVALHAQNIKIKKDMEWNIKNKVNNEDDKSENVVKEEPKKTLREIVQQVKDIEKEEGVKNNAIQDSIK